MGIPYTYFTDILSEANTSERSLSSSPNSNLVSNLHHGRNGLRQEKRVRISDEGGYVYSTTDVVVPSDSDVPTSSSLNPDEDNGLIHRLPHRDYMSAEIGSGINLRRKYSKCHFLSTHLFYCGFVSLKLPLCFHFIV